MELSYPFNTRRLARTVGAALCAACISAAAADERHNFEIAPQSLGAALNRFSETTDMQLSYPAELAEGVRSTGVSGAYTTEQALKKLLDGTGLTPRVTGNGIITIERTGANLSTDYLLAQAPKENYPPTVTDESLYDGPVEQEDLTVSGGDWSGYNVLNASTATKTDTPIMETPFSVQVVPRQLMDDVQAVRPGDALNYVSGVYQGSANSGGWLDWVKRRGFNPFPTGDYRDGGAFPLASAWGGRDLANIEQVEVLKGPGSLLYGQAIPGGVVNYVTKKPLATPYYSLQQQFGSYDYYRTTLDATGPISSDNTLLYRFNLAYKDENSFRDQVNSDRIFIAPVLTWNVSSQTSVHDKKYN